MHTRLKYRSYNEHATCNRTKNTDIYNDCSIRKQVDQDRELGFGYCVICVFLLLNVNILQLQKEAFSTAVLYAATNQCESWVLYYS